MKNEKNALEHLGARSAMNVQSEENKDLSGKNVLIRYLKINSAADHSGPTCVNRQEVHNIG